jgi:hypothetical protein
MNLAEIIFLPAILLFGVVTTYSDVKYRKIRNKHILGALIYTLVVYALLSFLRFPFSKQYWIDLVINLFVSLIVSVTIWIFGLWSAADAKLFIAYTSLTPLFFYSNTYFKFFPSFVLLINTFVPFFFLASVRILFLSTAKEKKSAIRNIKVKEILLIILTVIVASWIPRIIFLQFGIRFDFLINFIIILLCLSLFRVIFRKKMFAVLVCLAILRTIVDWRYAVSLTFLTSFVLMSLLVIAIFFMFRIGSFIFVKNIKIRKLKPGMILAHGNYILDKGKRFPLDSKLEGLNKKDIQKIVRLRKSSKLSSDEIKILEMQPFAPYIFLGVILTLITKGNFLLLVNYLK